MGKQLAGASTLLMVSLISFAEVRIRSAASQGTASAASAQVDAQKAAASLSAAAPATNACIEQVQRLTVRIDLAERMLWDTRGTVSRLRSSVLVRRNSPEFTARLYDPPKSLEDIAGPQTKLADLPAPARLDLPRIEMPNTL